ncbi:MAG: hypothetical protein FWB99_05150 [Treponema sp.]|nr:hypothetical protein [Treponema sp.]
MQKYTRMLCWIRPHEKKALKEAANNQFPLVFAKNYDDFKQQIKSRDFLVMSIVKAVRGLKKMQDLVRLFPQNKFYLYYRSNDDGFMTENEITLFFEENIEQGQFMSSGLVHYYLEQR